ncbi:MAG TPA: type II secretion system protein N [Rhodoferax sp.]
MLHADHSSIPNLWLLRLLTFLLAGMAAASSVFWVLQWPTRDASGQSPLATALPATIDSVKVATLLGANAAAEKGPVVNISSAYKLMGVIAEGGIGHQGTRGRALISVEGTSTKPYRVGDEVADGLVLQSVHARSVLLGHDGQTHGAVSLELPLLPGMTDRP